MQHRAVTMATGGVVAAPHYLASQAGVEMMRLGGNAVDAAIAANAVLNVVWPFGCSTGGDIFLLIYDAKSDNLNAFNGSGRAPKAATPDWFKANGHDSMPQRGMLAVTVPGAVDGWYQASAKFGKLDMATCLQPAIRYARDGFGVGHTFAATIAAVLKTDWPHPSWRAVFGPNERGPQVGEIFRQPELAATLSTIAEQGRDAFYSGPIATKIAEFSARNGGILTYEDLAAHQGFWTEPLSVNYRGYQIYELPPNTHGLTALQMLKLTEGFDFSADHADPRNLHLAVEAKKLAFADRDEYLTDPDHMGIKPEQLLADDYLNERRKLIDEAKSLPDFHPGKLNGDTIYLCAADGTGNAVSLIQSNYMGIGCGVCVDGTGLELQNRGAYFSLDPNKVNVIAPNKRTMHTLIPSMAFKDDKPAIVFGTMGGDGQPQFHQQVYANLIDFDMNIQQAIEAPRWVHGKNSPSEPPVLLMESRYPAATREALAAMGHRVQEAGDWTSAMGWAQGIVINPTNGLLMAGADPRADSAAIGI